MSYKISVPMINGSVERMGREALADALKELGAERVMLSLDCYETDTEKKNKALYDLRKNCEYFHGKGFEVCVWIWTFMINGEHDFTSLSMVKSEEKVHKNFACPLDEKFRAFAGEYIADIAKCGADMIMFDDDFRLGFYSKSTMGCICEHHRKRICEDIGENISREDLARKILEGGKNKYRDAWIKENGYSLELFAKNVRNYVDKVAPNVRVGLCACLSSWDIDGTDPLRLATLLAGANTRPFIRLIGAPYWASGDPTAWGNRLQDVIELERMESAWIGDADVEIMAEGDCYPRPRIKCPAAFLEGFDTAMRASSATDGILKYAIDYTSSPKYERGYIEFHKRNRKLYDVIDANMREKRACGVRVYENPQKVANMDLSKSEEPAVSAQYSFFSSAARMLASQAIPTVYEGRGVCGIAFGENARYLDEDARKSGLIIDGSAARILHEKGIDVGIESIGDAIPSVAEYFYGYDELIATYGARINNHLFNKNIKILSEGRQNGVGISIMGENSGDIAVPMAYTYENSNKERYLVLNIEAGDCAAKIDMSIMKHYLRGRQIADNVEWLSGGKRLPAYSYGNPSVYLMAKEDGDCLTVGLWNFYADIAIEPIVELGETYRELRCLWGCDGRLFGDKVKLTDIPAYGAVFLEVKK